MLSGANDLILSLVTKCCVNAFIDCGSRNVCLLAWWAGVLFLKAGQGMLYPVFPWQGKLLLGVLNPPQCFPLMQPFESVDEMPAIKGTSYSQFWQHESSELQVYEAKRR